jgi:SAM-dependent methyltransferase
MKFDSEYTTYWKSATVNSVDGTKIAGESEVTKYLEFMHARKFENTLDLGCSFGRMNKVLSKISSKVFGVDLDSAALDLAKEEGYFELSVGSTESIPYSEEFFDFVFCWAVFDVVAQRASLIEINRVLAKEGILFFTGKNSNYLESDELAFVAEKNAFLKEFPNRFTNLPALMKLLPKLGFEVEQLLIFEKRGDMGNLNFRIEPKVESEEIFGYEFLIICRKVGIPQKTRYLESDITSQFSITAQSKSKLKLYDSPESLFQSIGRN